MEEHSSTEGTKPTTICVTDWLLLAPSLFFCLIAVTGPRPLPVDGADARRHGHDGRHTMLDVDASCDGGQSPRACDLYRPDARWRHGGSGCVDCPAQSTRAGLAWACGRRMRDSGALLDVKRTPERCHV